MNAQLKIDEHSAHGEEHSLGVIEDVAVGLPGEGEAEAATDAQEHSAVKKARYDPNSGKRTRDSLPYSTRSSRRRRTRTSEGGERTVRCFGNLRGVGGGSE